MQPIELIDLVINRVGEYQDMGYKKLVEHLKRKNPKLSRGSGSISFTVLEAPLQALNMIYPHEGLGEDDVDDDTDEEIVEEISTNNLGASKWIAFNQCW